MDSKETIYTDPGLLRKHSEVIAVTTDKYKYPGIRIFYREHPKASVLPPKLPLLVFIHGMYLFRFILAEHLGLGLILLFRAWRSAVSIPVLTRIFCTS